ncbi:superoxide dismutase family protein [Acuticoccus sp. M5D2P5]|uniref:superoxide dismutase family protein n=1 Tax=Acuticoccus kalidii TaxID=2910977 RepID=UPI001F30CCBE|nr:superoxide dismutase family protein [Acuticoccus kalidii]MCF3936062.1 superoxide dismutase family protein [Acuticoccus kalidii]
MRKILRTSAAAMFLAATAAASAQDGMPTMMADVIDTSGASVGTVSFMQTPSGFVVIKADISGLEPGVHGFHIHETGECDAEGGFESAGGHYSGGMEHGVLTEGGPHAGDLPNVEVGGDGTLVTEIFTDRVSIGGETNPLDDADGSAIMVHSGADDYQSQPSGDAGSRVACGVLK